MAGEELLQRLYGWVESSGRALELRAARSFHGTRNIEQLNQSVFYEDQVSKQQREGDVLAVLRYATSSGLAVSIDVALECKASKDYPWVAFYDDREFVPDQPRLWFLYNREVGWDDRDLSALVARWLDAPALSTNRLATHVVSAFGKDGKNFASDAVRQTMSFARARAQDNYSYVGDRKGLRAVKLALPVVVTQAPLFTCELAADGEPVLASVDRFDVRLQDSRRDGWRRVYVRSESALSGMAEAVDEICEEFGGIGGIHST